MCNFRRGMLADCNFLLSSSGWLTDTASAPATPMVLPVFSIVNLFVWGLCVCYQELLTERKMCFCWVKLTVTINESKCGFLTCSKQILNVFPPKMFWMTSLETVAAFPQTQFSYIWVKSERESVNQTHSQKLSHSSELTLDLIMSHIKQTEPNRPFTQHIIDLKGPFSRCNLYYIQSWRVQM